MQRETEESASKKKKQLWRQSAVLKPFELSTSTGKQDNVSAILEKI